MGEYARVMVKTVSRWLIGLTRLQSTIDCLLKSKFVGYTANFTKNLDVIIDGADVFFHHKNSSSLLDVDCNKILVGGIPGYFDPFVDNERDLDADAIPASKVLTIENCASVFDIQGLHLHLTEYYLHHQRLLS
jgi:hypothetical protein